MYYSNGNYEAFARPKKPANATKKSAYIVGAGLAGLAAAAFLVRDGQGRWCQDYGQAFLAPRGTALRKFFKTRISA